MQRDSGHQVIERLRKIIQKNEQKLTYFQNRLKQAQFMDRANMRMVVAAEGQVGSYTDQLGTLHSQLHELERLYGGGVKLRTTEEQDLRRIWRWTNEPALRKILRTETMTFPAYVDSWHRWLADEDAHPLSIDLAASGLIGFLLMTCTGRAWEARHASLDFIVIRSDCRYRGYGMEAMKRAIAFAFEQLGVDTFGARVEADNYAAFLCFEKSGLQCIDWEYSMRSERYRMEMGREVWEGATAPPAEFTSRQPEHGVSTEASNPYLTAKLLAPLKELVSDH
ncbi:MAG: GNAT family N-acetyltransferase [Candidatus Poribacteria bacterium]|nr:GNAT family N-acetyltransferase [Candidatus Poribacteria bacterium]